MKHTTTIALCTIVLLASCKKDDDGSTPAAPSNDPTSLAHVSEYGQLDSGNYWVYQKYKVDSTDVVLETLGMDSVWMTGDSVIDGETFKTVYRAPSGSPGAMPRFWRDSLDFLVTATHEKLFWSAPLDQVVYSVYQGPYGVIMDYSVSSTPETVAVPAGTFTTHRMSAEITSIGGFPEQPDWKSPRYFWAEGVGRVRYYEAYSSASWSYRYDLVRYHVQ